MIDTELVDRKLLLIARDLVALGELARLDLAAFLAVPANQVLAERYVERITGRMIDVNYHLLTESGQPPPPDYFQSFLELAALGVCDHAFARRIAAYAGLRNRIAHEYDEIDPEKLFEAVRQAARGIPEYARQVQDWLARR